MIRVTTPAGKKALAESLQRHDSETLDWLRDMAGVFGAFAEVGYESEDPERQKAVVEEVSAARSAHVASERERAKAEIAKMRRATD